MRQTVSSCGWKCVKTTSGPFPCIVGWDIGSLALPGLLRRSRRCLAVRATDSLLRALSRISSGALLPPDTEFTCGPSALIMAMAALDEQQPVSTLEELKIGKPPPSSCWPGMAVVAPMNAICLAPGFEASAWISQEGALFKDTVRNEDKKRYWNWCTRGSCTIWAD